ncbi:hypothetical protein H5T53_05910 [Candidatus Bipolaricaulota bacterium]|nr:hypothetical protein [Candidatus Bipolaricaulota bacterium]
MACWKMEEGFRCPAPRRARLSRRLPARWGAKLAVFQPGAGACSADPARVQVQAEAGGLTVSGAFLAPTPCHSLRAVLGHPSQGELVLTITAAPSEEMCVQCLALIPYEGRNEGLAHGRWHLRVYHEAELLWDAWHEVTPP